MRALSSHERYAHTTGHKMRPDTRTLDSTNNNANR